MPARITMLRRALRPIGAIVGLAGALAVLPHPSASADEAPEPLRHQPPVTRLAAALSRTRIGFGNSVTVTAVLRTDAGPVPAEDLTLQSRTASGAWVDYRTVTTDVNGRIVVTFRPTRTTTVRVTHDHTSQFAASTSSAATVTVTPTLTPLTFGQRIVAEASRHRGKPYRWGATGPGSFDCSGFTRYVYGRLGRSLPHNSGAQFSSSRRIPASQVRVGDLVFNGSGAIHHVGIYAGNGEMWASPQTGGYVSLRRVPSGFRAGRIQ